MHQRVNNTSLFRLLGGDSGEPHQRPPIPRQLKRIYAQRKAIVEPVNGQIKEVRGLRRFLLRGLEKVDGEWHLIAATHNLLKLFRFRRAQQQVLMAATG